jgi:4-amino-4-deoxy-L-arabinose transferase-like glycosyltransferase
MFEIGKGDAIFLSLLAGFCAANNFIWLTLDSVPPAWDEASYLTWSIQYYNLLRHLGPTLYRNFLSLSSYRPPLVFLVPSLTYPLFGLSKTVAAMTNTLFWIILLLACYGIGRALQDAGTGLLASFFVSMYPPLFSLSRYFLLDFALTSVAALGFFLFLKSDRFTRRGASIAFGAVLGLGMLIKWTYFVFMIGPLLMVLFGWVSIVLKARRSGEHCGKWCGARSRPTKNLAIAISLSIIISCVWYLPNIGLIFGSLIWAGFGQGAQPYAQGGLLGLQSLTFYLSGIITGISLVFSLVFLVFAVYSLRSHSKTIVLLLVSLAIPYAIFTMTVDKDTRFMMPVLPLIDIVSAIGISRIPRMRLKAFLILSLAFVGMLQFLSLTYGSVYLPQASRSGIPLFADETFYVRPPRNEDWRIDLILHTVDDERAVAGKTLIIGVLPDHQVINAATLNYYAAEGNYTLSFWQCVSDPNFNEDLHKFDYVLTKTGSSISPFQSKSIQLQEFFLEHQDGFTLVRSISMPDGSAVSIYKNLNT